jgi:hypothetical protein
LNPDELEVRLDHSSNIKYLNQVLENHLYEPDAGILAMIMYGQANKKTIAYLFDGELLVGWAYLEHFPGNSAFGVFIDPEYRGKGGLSLLLHALQDYLYKLRKWGLIIEADESIAPLLKTVFQGHVIKEIPRQNPDIPKEGLKPKLNFYGYDDGRFDEVNEYLGQWMHVYDWEMITGMASMNNWKIYHVTGASEHHLGFRQALCRMVDKYPELVDYWIDFDGPAKRIGDLTQGSPMCINWSQMKFYHGTSTALLDRILDQGLCPRNITGIEPTYGTICTRAKPGRADAVYLTTQLSMAEFAAHDAKCKHGGERVILLVKGIDGCKAIPDVDSDEPTAELSLQRMGSIGYLGCISPEAIEIFK